MTGESNFERALSYVSREARYYVLDSLYCELFNMAGDLAGNTARADVNWLAGRIYARATGGACNDIDRTSEDVQEFYRTVAVCALDLLPEICHRMASRLRVQADVVEILAREAHAELKEAKRTRFVRRNYLPRDED